MRTKRKILSRTGIALVMLLLPAVCAAADAQVSSVHAGFLYPNGVDLIGYTVERRIGPDVYGFYTFGFPSLAAAGLEYYVDYEGSGFSGAVGVGIGSILYAAIAHQWKIGSMQYLKTGAGFTTGIAYTGPYPVISLRIQILNPQLPTLGE